MIVKVNQSGSVSDVCQGQVEIPRGYRTIELMSINLPDNATLRFPAFTGEPWSDIPGPPESRRIQYNT